MRPLVDRFAMLLAHLLTLVLLALAGYVRWLPSTPTAIPEEGSAESHWWGLWPATYLPGWVFFGGATLIILAMIVFWAIALRNPIAQQLQIQPQYRPATWVMIAVSSGFVLAFYAFPICHTRWGDAYILTKAIAHPDPAIRLTHSWQAPLDVFLHSQLWLALHEKMNWPDAMPVYHLLSPIAGLLYLGAAVAISRAAKQYLATPEWLTFGLLTSLGVMQLFFGYIENYSYAAAGILIYLWLALLALQGSIPLWPVSLALAITNAMHPSTIVYWPSLCWLVWQLGRNRGRRNNRWWPNISQLVIPLLLIVGATIGMMEAGGHGLIALLTTDRPGGGDARWLVPLWTTSTRWERYTMVSWPHLRDIINEQLLVAPLLLPVLMILVVSRLRHKPRANFRTIDECEPSNGTVQRHYIILLALAAGAHLLLTWIWNPDYGGQRDWDLFSLASIPTALLTAQLLASPVGIPRTLQAGLLPLLMLQYAQLVSWVYQNTLPWEWP